jgi:hypothetical protein
VKSAGSWEAGCSDGGVTIGRDGRRQRRVAARQSVGQQADDRRARCCDDGVGSYSDVKQPALESIRDGDGSSVQRARKEQENTVAFRRRPIYLFLTSQRASGLRYPFKGQLELAPRGLGTTALCSSSGGRELWGQANAVARWAPTCTGAHQKSTASLPW